MAALEELKKEVEEIKRRNERVESDKAWETSWTRKALLALFTYLAMGAYLWAVNIRDPWLNANSTSSCIRPLNPDTAVFQEALAAKDIQKTLK